MKEKNVNSIYDISKIVLSIMIIIIHTGLLTKVFYPWVRIAVPLFFIISSYFLFSKLSKTVDEKEKKTIMIKYLVRNLKLYFFWFIVLFPITLELRGYFVNQSIFKGILIILRDFFFGGTFAASWFIMAMILSSLLIYFLSKKMSDKLLLIIALIIYIIITLKNSYTFLMPESILNNDLLKYFNYLIKYSYNSFLVALIWTICGKCFVNNIFNWKLKSNIFLFILSLLLLWIEWYYLGKITNIDTFDCYIMLIPFCISIFWFIKNTKEIYFSKSVLLRRLSTIFYVTHASIIFALKKYFSLNNSFLLFIITLVLGIIIFVIINYLSNKKYFHWLKNAY